MNDIVSSTLLVTGAAFALLAGIGVLRMPDVFMRMQVATKAATMGVAGVALGAAAHFADLSTSSRAVLIVFFLFLTAPVAAHAIGRAAYIAGARLWDRTVIDELRDRYPVPDGPDGEAEHPGDERVTTAGSLSVGRSDRPGRTP